MKKSALQPTLHDMATDIVRRQLERLLAKQADAVTKDEADWSLSAYKALSNGAELKEDENLKRVATDKLLALVDDD